jgi:hypothetical protein
LKGQAPDGFIAASDHFTWVSPNLARTHRGSILRAEE